jgi:hypothetical protein
MDGNERISGKGAEIDVLTTPWLRIGRVLDYPRREVPDAVYGN